VNRIIQEKNKRRLDRAIQSKLKPYLISLWVLCFCSLIYTFLNFRDVLIDYKLPLLLGGFCGFIGIVFTKRRDNYFFAFFGYGSLFLGIPLFINNTFADNTPLISKEIINKKEHSRVRYGKKFGVVEIKFNDLNKELNVGEDLRKMDSSSYIILTVNKGLLGYNIIKDYKLVKE
jgi:hypothetical protein